MLKISKIAEMLGVKVNEEFRINMSYDMYRLTKQGLENKHSDSTWQASGEEDLRNILFNDETKVIYPFQPPSRIGEVYFYPDFIEWTIAEKKWKDDAADNLLRKMGLAFAKKENAISFLIRMEKVIANERFSFEKECCVRES